MSLLRSCGVCLAGGAILALGLYELTAKSPHWLGTPLPGWHMTERAERTVRWETPTGLLPVDKLLHESREAANFYGALAQRGPQSQSR